MSLKKIISEELLFEGRIDNAKKFVIQDFKNLLVPPSVKNGSRMPLWFNYLVENDPSGNQKYLMWALKQIKKHKTSFNPFGDYGYLEEQLVKTINEFHDLNEKLTPENIKKTINWTATSNPQTFSVVMGNVYDRYSVDDLNVILKNPKDINSYNDYFLLLSILNAIQEVPSKSDIKKEALRIFEDPSLLVIYPSTWRSSCYYGSNTRWCTSERNSDTHFSKHQTKVSSLFYFIPKERRNFDVGGYFADYGDEEYDLSKFALFIGSSGNMIFYDASDTEIDYNTMYDIISVSFSSGFLTSFKKGIEDCLSFHKSKRQN